MTAARRLPLKQLKNYIPYMGADLPFCLTVFEFFLKKFHTKATKKEKNTKGGKIEEESLAEAQRKKGIGKIAVSSEQFRCLRAWSWQDAMLANFALWSLRQAQ
ncbi:hypothetical protein [Treponema sp. R8-4-B8]